MKPRLLLNCLIGLLCAITPLSSTAQTVGRTVIRESFRGKIVFFGNSRGGARLVETMSLDGTDLQSVFGRNAKEFRILGGRLSPNGEFAAVAVMQPQIKKSAVLILSADGRHETIFEDDGALTIRCWSPDGKRVAFFEGEHGHWQNLTVDFESRKVEIVPLPATDAIEDWRPDGHAFSVMAGNDDKGRRFDDGEEYPLRGIYLAKPNGARMADLTKDPRSDFIWSRFSPDGHKIASYHRYYRDANDFKDGHAFEACSIADEDGSNSRDLVCFTRLLQPAKGAQGIRPNGGPVWSPDGKSLIWIATKQVNPTDDDAFELIYVPTDGSDVRRLPLGTERSFWGQIDCR